MFKGIMRNGVVESGTREVREEVSEYVLRKTTDYAIFNELDGNRDIDNANVKSLITSMEEKYYINPILVNERMEIVDGQHRFRACKELRLPIYYIIQEGLELEDVKRLNTIGKNWKPKDYLESNKRETNINNENYKLMESVMKEFNITIENFLLLVNKIRPESKISDIRNDFKLGTLIINEEEQIIIKDYLSTLEDFNPFKNYHNVHFFKAFFKMYTTEGYDHKVMKVKLEKYGDMLTSRFGESDYCEELVDLYNKNTKKGSFADFSKRKGFSFEII